MSSILTGALDPFIGRLRVRCKWTWAAGTRDGANSSSLKPILFQIADLHVRVVAGRQEMDQCHNPEGGERRQGTAWAHLFRGVTAERR